MNDSAGFEQKRDGTWPPPPDHILARYLIPLIQERLRLIRLAEHKQIRIMT